MPESQFRVDALPLSATNIAVADIIAQLRTLTDVNGDVIFASPDTQVAYGIGLGENGELTDETTPAIRVWYDSFTMRANATQFYIGKIMPIELSLYVYLYSESDDNTIPYRQALCEHIVRYLQEPESGVTGASGLMPKRGEEGTDRFIWSFAEDQEVIVDHTSVFKKINGSIAILPPFYGSRIDITLHARNTISEDLDAWLRTI